MSRLVSLLRRKLSSKNRCFFQQKSQSFTTHPHILQELDQTMDSVHFISSNPCFQFLSFCRNIDILKRIHGLFIVHGLKDDILCDTKLVSLYGGFGNLRYARKVFDQIPHPDLYSCKVMIRCYFLNEKRVEIIKFYAGMRMYGFASDNIVFSIVLKACSELRNLNEGRKLHCQIAKAGNPDSFLLTGLVDMYAKCGEIHQSREVFDEILDRSVVCWTSMIVGYVQNDCPKEGLVLFNWMRGSSVLGNEYTYGCLVTACTKQGLLHQGKWIHGYVIKNGTVLNSHLITSILDMYVKCGDIADARLVFDEQSSVDLVSWTAMIVGYTQSNLPGEALNLFIDKKWAGVVPNYVTIASAISACGQLGNLKIGRSVHAIAIELGVEDPAVMNSLVNMYAKCGENKLARYLFETDSEKDVTAWDSIISGFSQSGSAREALLLFHQMRLDSIAADAVTFVSLFSASAHLGAHAVGSSLHGYAVKVGLVSNVCVGTALLNLYAKCGDAKSARRVFDDMGEKNTITWSAMIAGYGKQGDTEGSIELFDDMLRKKQKPSEVVFTSILSACGHTGNVREGKKYFSAMYNQYKHMPSMKHYACMVDMLSRAGRLEEAMDFIAKMPIEPDVSCFGAFLHGCGLHSRFDLGEVVIKKMLDLHPYEACYYVLVSNLYASDGRWSQVNRVRELMKQKGLSKSAGRSMVQTDAHEKLLVSTG